MTDAPGSERGPLGIAEIERLILHRYPFLLVDRVHDWREGKWLAAVKNVTANEPQFTGHFPGNPLMPGVLMVEALAQASALLGMLSIAAGERPPLWLMVGIDKTRIKRMVVPGEAMDMRVEVLRARRDIWRVAGRIEVAGQLACATELTSMIKRL